MKIVNLGMTGTTYKRSQSGKHRDDTAKSRTGGLWTGWATQQILKWPGRMASK